MTRLRWDVSDRLSVLHAAHCWAAGTPGIDPLLVAKIGPPLTVLSSRLVACEIDIGLFWSRLVAVAAGGASDAEACHSALESAGLGFLAVDSAAAAITSGLAETRLAYQERFPKAAGQLELRARPIREQWDAYGRGLLRRIGRQTHESYLPKSIAGVMLTPYRGGDGDSDPAQETFWLEAVLTNPVAAVPEVLRVAWLVTRVGIARQLFAPAATKLAVDGDGSGSEPNAARSALVVALAALPVTLDAAVYLEITSAAAVDDTLIAAALAAWFPAGLGLTTSDELPGLAETLAKWWQQHQQLQPPFPVSLKALDRMLPTAPGLERGTTG